MDLKAKNDSTITTKYRLIFLPDKEYHEIVAAINPDRRITYKTLSDQGVDNLSIGESLVIFIPDRHRKFMELKARSGESF